MRLDHRLRLQILHGVGQFAIAGGVDHFARAVRQVHAVGIELVLDPATDLARIAVLLGGTRRR